MVTDTKLRVLVVDDEPDMRDLLRHVLLQAGHEVVGEAADGRAAIAAAAELTPDVVTLDLTMPVAGGELALPHILTVSPRSMVAVCTAALEPGLAGRLASLGAFACYPKTDLSDLGARLTRDFILFRRALSGQDVTAPWVWELPSFGPGLGARPAV